MGFNFHGYGNIHSCWISGGYVYEETICTKRVYSYATRLNVEIPKQLNLFVSNTVAFLLYHEDKMYIGRYDGVISIYRRRDNLLVGLNNWDAPKVPYLYTAGFLDTAAGARSVKLDKRDNLTLYTRFNRIEAKLEKPFEYDYSSMVNVHEKSMDGDMSKFKVYTEEGEVIGTDVWFVQDDLRRQNCPIFV